MRVCLTEPKVLFATLQRRKLFYEDRDRAVIAEVRAVGPKPLYLLSAVHGQGNRRVATTVLHEVTSEFAQAGVFAWEAVERPSAWDAVERLTCGLASLEDELDELRALDFGPVDEITDETDEPEFDLTPVTTTEAA